MGAWQSSPISGSPRLSHWCQDLGTKPAYYEIYALPAGKIIGRAKHAAEPFLEDGFVAVSPFTSVRPMFTPDSKRLYTMTNRSSRLWDLTTLSEGTSDD